MFRKISCLAIVILVLALLGCDIRTPEIRGVVLDEETKQPIENAWVTAVSEIESKTISGGVHQTIFVGKTWSGKNGEFVIPAKLFKKQISWMAFGTRMESLNIGARAITGRGYLSEGVKSDPNKRDSQIILIVKMPKDWMHYRSAIHGLYDFILIGKLGDADTLIPKEERMEIIDLAIKSAEDYGAKFGEGATREENNSYVAVMKNLGYLYSWKADYEKALETFKKLFDFDEKRNVTVFLEEFKMQIKENQMKLNKIRERKKGV
jgi:hypothetical protein